MPQSTLGAFTTTSHPMHRFSLIFSARAAIPAAFCGGKRWSPRVPPCTYVKVPLTPHVELSQQPMASPAPRPTLTFGYGQHVPSIWIWKQAELESLRTSEGVWGEERGSRGSRTCAREGACSREQQQWWVFCTSVFVSV